MMTPTKVKLQTSIFDSNIIIDSWNLKSSKENDSLFRFMTSIKKHSIHAVTLMRKEKYYIYTSLFNKWYLHQFYKIPENRIIVLNFGKTVELFNSSTNEKFCVTAMDANYCPGSTMFLFQGSFGNVLYTGYFRTPTSFKLEDYPILKQLTEEKNLHVAYIDNSFAAEHCIFPTRYETIQKVTQLIRGSANSDVIISCNQLGKEEVLLAVASELNEKIDVSSDRFEIFRQLNLSDFFTKNTEETRIRAVDRLLTFTECRNMKNKSCLIILLTALYEFGPKIFPHFPRLFIIPYSGHCNHFELKQFVSLLRPHTILPLVKLISRRSCCVIPKSIYELCAQDDSLDCQSKVPEKLDKKYLPIVLIEKLILPHEVRTPIHKSDCGSVSVNLPKNGLTESSMISVCHPIIDNGEYAQETSTTPVNSQEHSEQRSQNIQNPSAVEEHDSVKKYSKNVKNKKCANKEIMLPEITRNEITTNGNVFNACSTQTDMPNASGVCESSLSASVTPNGHFICEKNNDSLSDFIHSHSPRHEESSFKDVPNDKPCTEHSSLLTKFIIEEKNSVTDPIERENLVPGVIEDENLVSRVIEGENPIADVSEEENSVSSVIEDENLVSVVIEEENPVADVSEEENLVSCVIEDENLVSIVIEEENPVADVSEEENSVPGVTEDENLVSVVIEEENPVADVSEEENSVPGVIEDENLVSVVIEEKNPVASVSEEENSALGIIEDENLVSGVIEGENPVAGVFEEENLVPGVIEDENLVSGAIEKENPVVEEEISVVGVVEKDGVCSNYSFPNKTCRTSSNCLNENNSCKIVSVNENVNQNNNLCLESCSESISMLELVSQSYASENKSVSVDKSDNNRGHSNSLENSLHSSKQSQPCEERIIDSLILSQSAHHRIFTSGEEEFSVSLTVNANYSISKAKSIINENNADCLENSYSTSLSSHDVTLFDINEHSSCNLLADKDVPRVDMKPETDDEMNLQIIESNHESVNSSDIVKLNLNACNSSHLPMRSSKRNRRSDGNYIFQSDSDDCLITGEYKILESDGQVFQLDSDDCLITGEYKILESDGQASKKLKLDRTPHLQKHNLTNATLLHYCKLFDNEIPNLVSNPWSFLSNSDIFSHWAYKRS